MATGHGRSMTADHEASFTDMAESMCGDTPDWDTEPVPPESLAHADRMLARLARIERANEADRHIYQARLDDLDGWLDRRQAVTDQQRTWLSDALAQFHRALIARDPKAKTLDFPSGVLKSRHQQPEWEIDGPVFVAWAAANRPELVSHPPAPVARPDVTAAKKALLIADPAAQPGVVVDAVNPETSEIVPGVRVTMRPRTFTAIPRGDGT